MIVKFFNTKKGGGNSAIDYLLDKRVEQGTSRILQGDENLTRDIIKNMSQKHKTCVGVLSFEEKDIDEQLKFKLMADFEKALMTDEAQGRYNILWVEHNDKGRLELNFVIPKIDLQTKKALNPYYHNADLSRIASWQDIKNIEYNFENPKDPSKEQTIQGSKKQVEIYKDYEKLDNFLQQEVKNGTLQSRAEIIKLLQDNGVEVTRQGKDYLGIKLPDNTKAKRFKGGIYSDEFGNIESLRTIGDKQEKREREFSQRDNRAELERLRNQFERAYNAKSEYYKREFEKRDRQHKNRYDNYRAGIDEFKANEHKADNFIDNSISSDFSPISETSRSDIDDSVRSRIDERARQLREREQEAIRTAKRTRADYKPTQKEPIRLNEREYALLADNRKQQQEPIIDENYIREREKRKREAIKRIRELREARERQRNTELEASIKPSFERLREVREGIKQQHERHTIFADIFRQSEASFRKHITGRIQEFGRQFQRNITEFGETLREQGKRSIKSGIDEVRAFINKHKRELERVLERERQRHRSR